MPDEKVNVFEQRERFVQELKHKVDGAFNNRLVTKFTTNAKTSDEEIAEARQANDFWSGRDDESYVEAAPLPNWPWAVGVKNSHDYKLLLEMALQKLVEIGTQTEDGIPSAVSSILDHEFAHHVPALGHEGLETTYLVTFFENEETHEIGFQPSVFLTGKLQVGVYRDVLTAPKKLSDTDSIKTEHVRSIA